MKIAVINHYAGSPEMGMEYRPYYLAQEWLKKGHRVTIFAASYSHLRTVQPQVTGKYTVEFIDEIQYVWIKTPYYSGNGIKRVINIFTFVIRLFFYVGKIKKADGFDCVIASSTYPLDIIPSIKLARKNKAKLVHELHDLWPLTLIELGGFKKWHPFIVLLQMAENYTYSQIDKEISILPDTLPYMEEHGLNRNKWYHVPNGFCPGEIEEITKMPDDIREKIESIKRNKKQIIGYAGSHGTSNVLDYLLQVAKTLQNDQRFVFLIIGKGPDKERLMQYAHDNNLQNVIFSDPIPKQAIQDALRSCDFLYLGWKKSKLYQYGISPNKLIDYMVSARPIIHSVNSTKDLVQEAHCGMSVEPENPKAIAEAIFYLSGISENERKTMGENGRNYAYKRLTYEVLSENFIQAINS